MAKLLSVVIAGTLAHGAAGRLLISGMFNDSMVPKRPLNPSTYLEASVFFAAIAAPLCVGCRHCESVGNLNRFFMDSALPQCVACTPLR